MKLKKSSYKNFLKNEIISYKISKNIINSKSKNLLEFSAGEGSITSFLIERKWDNYYIIEYDDLCASKIKEKFKNVKVFCKSILDFDLLKYEKVWSVIGQIPSNLPNSLIYGILKKIVSWRNNLEKVVLILGEEIAQKIYKKESNEYGAITILMQLFFEIDLLEKINPEDFFPKAKGSSRAISLKLKENKVEINDYENFCNFLEIMCRFPRKMIRNNLFGTKYENFLPFEILDKRVQEIPAELILDFWKNK